MTPEKVENLKLEYPRESEAELSGDIPFEELASYRAHALEHLAEHTEIPGFRKGHVPEKILVDRLGETAVMFEAVEHALQELFPRLLEAHKLHAIGRPDITITKLAPGNPVGFKITVALMPQVKLPDYKKLAKEVMEKEEVAEVTGEEVQKFIDELGKRYNQEQKKPEDAPLPELTDEYVQSMGDFKDVTDFRDKVQKGMRREKEARIREKKRIEVSDKIIEGAAIPLPRILIDSELEKMFGQFREDLSRMQIKFDEYLARIKKTEDDLRKEWEPDAIKRAKLQLALNEIAKVEKIEPKTEMVNHEVEHLLEHIKDANPDRLRIYVETMLTNEEVFKFLENQRKEPEEKK